MNNLIEILEKEGIEQAVKALDNHPYKFYCLFLADVAESVLPIFEKEHPDDSRPRLAIQGIRDFHEKKITEEELNSLMSAAFHAADNTADNTAAAYHVADNDYFAPASVIFTYVTCVAIGRQKRKEIEKLFIKHFGDK